MSCNKIPKVSFSNAVQLVYHLVGQGGTEPLAKGAKFYARGYAIYFIYDGKKWERRLAIKLFEF